MLSFLSGLVVTGAGVAGLWYSMPKNGQVRWFVVAPVLDWFVPTLIVAALAIGITMTVAGVVG